MGIVVELEQAVSVEKMAQLQDLEKVNQQLLSDIERIKQSAEESKRTVLEQQARIAKLTTSKAELEDQLRLQAELAREEKKKLRNKYEYELGIMTGMNEAIMNQNDQMRLRILEQNDKIRELTLCSFMIARQHRNICSFKWRSDCRACHFIY